MKTLSPKQQQIYDYIVSFSGLHGYPPSVREIGAAVGLKSPSTVHFHLKHLEELAAAHPTVKVGKVNTDENLQLAMARKIDAIPALLLFKNGQEVSRSVGYRPAAELEAWLRENGAI